MDNARYQIEEHMKKLKNIRPMYLPAYRSELNPIEHLWKNLRTVVTHNTLFESFNKLIEQINVYF